MPSFNAKNIISEIQKFNEENKRKRAESNLVIKQEIKNVLEDTKEGLYNQPRESVAKYVLWQGLLNQYGIFGTKREEKRLFGKEKNICYYERQYNHGDLISIDFGTSNIGEEFSFTHTAIVLKSYTDYVVVIPTTSCKEGRLDSKPLDEQEDTLIITKEDYKNIESDSYIMLYQIRSVSKNRIQKAIGTIAETQIMSEIDKKLALIYAPGICKDCPEKV